MRTKEVWCSRSLKSLVSIFKTRGVTIPTKSIVKYRKLNNHEKYTNHIIIFNQPHRVFTNS